MSTNIAWRQCIQNRVYAIPIVAQWWARWAAQRTVAAEASDTGIPFAPMTTRLSNATVSLITTGGVHGIHQPPFDMVDPDGDASFRQIPGDVDLDDLTITHDYYNHGDADRDLNIVFPLQRFRELVSRGVVGQVARRHFGLMGHIEGAHLARLKDATAPEIGAMLRADGVDFAFLTPA